MIDKKNSCIVHKLIAKYSKTFQKWIKSQKSGYVSTISQFIYIAVD